MSQHSTWRGSGIRVSVSLGSKTPFCAVLFSLSVPFPDRTSQALQRKKDCIFWRKIRNNCKRRGWHLAEHWVWSGAKLESNVWRSLTKPTHRSVQVCNSHKAWKLLQNEYYLLAKLGFDTAENEASKTWQTIRPPLPARHKYRSAPPLISALVPSFLHNASARARSVRSYVSVSCPTGRTYVSSNSIYVLEVK